MPDKKLELDEIGDEEIKRFSEYIKRTCKNSIAGICEEECERKAY
jgi:hypothetical protein